MTFAFLLMVCAIAFAQPKGSSSKAKAHMDKGELADAKAEIEAYLASDKFKKKPKSSGYLLQGEIYKAIATSDKEEDQALMDDPIGKALEAFNKVKGLAKEGSADYKKIYDNQGLDPTTFQPIPGLIEQMRNHFFNQGATLYNDDEDYEGAMKAFEACYRIEPNDTTSATYAFQCASVAEDEKGMLKSFDKLVELKYAQPGPYTTMARVHFAKGMELSEEDKKEEAKKEYEKMLAMANKGLENIPNSIDLIKFKIEAYIRLDRADDAINLLKKAVETNPQDSISHFSLGALYEGKKDYDMAEASYKKAVEIAPNYYNANLNFAAFYIERAKEVKREVEALVGPTGQYTDPKKAEQLSAKRKDHLKNALTYLEKCNSLKPGDSEISTNIETIKALLKRND